MKDQLKTIRAGVAEFAEGDGQTGLSMILEAVAQLEAMVGEPVLIVQDGEICYKSKSDDQSYGMWCPVTPDADHGLSNSTKLYARQARADLEAENARLREALKSLAEAAPTSLRCEDFHHPARDRHGIGGHCGPKARYVTALNGAIAALESKP